MCYSGATSRRAAVVGDDRDLTRVTDGEWSGTRETAAERAADHKVDILFFAPDGKPPEQSAYKIRAT